MKTYLTLYLYSEGARPSEVTKKLERMGFVALQGPYDFMYDWRRDATVDEVVEFGDKVRVLLKELRVYFKMETI